MKFKGFEDYIEIFRGGKQIDSIGVEHDGDKLIDNALASFDTATHEPPAVIGHPNNNAPAFAWVESLKDKTVDGVRILTARFKQVVPEFEDMVKKGLFKKRSASFYPDGRLRHVGFLGAAPPAVKGLADVFAGDEDQITFEFEESRKIQSIGRLLAGIREFIIEKFSLEDADRVIPSWSVEDIKEQPPGESFSAGTDNKGEDKMEFSQEELDRKLAKAEEAGRKKATDEAAKKRRERQFSNDLDKVREFCGQMVQEGKVAPAWIDSGLQTFMESLAGKKPLEFAEGKTESPLDWVMDFFENQMPKLVEFKEVAGRDQDLPDVDPEFAEIDDQERLEQHRKIQALQKKENISYAEAADRILG